MKKTLLLISISFLFINVLFINAQSSSKSLMNLQAFEKKNKRFNKRSGLLRKKADKFFRLTLNFQERN